MKAPALVVAAALALGGAAFAADSHDSGSAGSPAKESAHHLATGFKEAMHKLGEATRHALHRADAALHKGGDHNS